METTKTRKTAKSSAAVVNTTLPRIKRMAIDAGGWFWWLSGGVVIVRCPECLREQTIGHNHEIASDGTVTPSIGCVGVNGSRDRPPVRDGCQWHVWATLADYRGEESIDVEGLK